MFYALIIVAVYILMMLLVQMFHSRLVYFPAKEIKRTPEYLGLNYEDVYFKTEDGLKLNGWFIESKKRGKVLLYSHGNGGNISHRIDLIDIYIRAGYSVFIYDYRGYGKSEGKPNEKGTYLDGEAAWNYLINEKKYEPKDIILLGRSIGGGIATYLAVHRKPSGLILDSAFTSVKDMARKLFPYLPVRFMKTYGYDNIKRIKNIKCPVLIIHSSEDELIPFDHGKRLFEAANMPKTFVEIKGMHDDSFYVSEKRYASAIEEFIKDL